MEKIKKLLPYLFVVIFIAVIMIFVVIPSNGTKELICVSSTNETGIKTDFDLKIVYENGNFKEVYHNIKFDLSKNWIEKDAYVNSIENDSSDYIEMGFEHEVVTDRDNKTVIAKMYGTKDTLNKDLIFFSKINDVEKHYENVGYICEVEDFN